MGKICNKITITSSCGFRINNQFSDCLTILKNKITYYSETSAFDHLILKESFELMFEGYQEYVRHNLTPNHLFQYVDSSTFEVAEERLVSDGVDLLMTLYFDDGSYKEMHLSGSYPNEENPIINQFFEILYFLIRSSSIRPPYLEFDEFGDYAQKVDLM